ncbi:hypothetical protein ACOI9P_06185 [Corynebacterium striatum]
METADDADVDLSNPTVENPATAHLQPTPQLDIDNYQKGSGALQ